LYPPGIALCVKHEGIIDGLIPDGREIDRHQGGRRSTAPAVDEEVEPREGVPEVIREDRDLGAPADRRSTPLELVHGEIDAVPEERLEGPLHAVPVDQPLQVAVFAAGE